MNGESACYAIVFFAEALIALAYAEYLFSRKRTLLLVIILIAAEYLILFVISEVIDVIAVNTISFFAVNTLLICLNYSCDLKTAIMHSGILAFVMSTSEIIMALFLRRFFGEYDAYTYNFAAMIALAVTSKLLYFLCAMLIAFIFKPHKDMGKDPVYLALLTALPIASFIIADFVIYVGMTASLNRTTQVLMVASVLLLLFVNIFILLAYNHSQNLNTEYTTLRLAAFKDQADTAYYQMLQTQYESQRVLIHDIKNHFIAIESLALEGKTDEIREYIEKIEGTPGFKNRVRLCGDPILNMILLRYAQYCEETGIELNHDIRTDSLSFQDADDITSLFGNLLSNAIEAAEVSEEKHVEISVVKNTAAGVMIVSVINSCDVPPVEDGRGCMKTQKLDAENHGFGTKSINRVVRKYKGSSKMHYYAEDRRFCCTIQFPI